MAQRDIYHKTVITALGKDGWQITDDPLVLKWGQKEINQYQQLVEQVLTQYLELHYANADIHNESIFNHEAGQYVVMSSGWQGARRIHGCLLHLKIQDGKVWIERDGTETGIANDLIAAGIPRDAIVLGFYSSAARK